MTHWEVVWVCFALTAGVLVFDFWAAHRAASQLRERMMLGTEESGENAGG